VGEDGSPAISRNRINAMNRAMADVAGGFKALFDSRPLDQEAGAFLRKARTALQGAVTRAFDQNQTRLSTDFGIEFDFDDRNGRVFRFLEQDKQRFSAAVRNDFHSVEDFLFKAPSGQRTGLVESLGSTLDLLSEDLEKSLASASVYVDTYA
jgi:hypothetical protein